MKKEVEEKNANDDVQMRSDGYRTDVIMAFNQEDLENAYKMKVDAVYLVEGAFTIPADKQDVDYLLLGEPTVMTSRRLEQNRAPEENESPRDVVSAGENDVRNKPEDNAAVSHHALPPVCALFFTNSGSFRGSGSGSGSGSGVFGCGLCGYGIELI